MYKNAMNVLVVSGQNPRRLDRASPGSPVKSRIHPSEADAFQTLVPYVACSRAWLAVTKDQPDPIQPVAPDLALPVHPYIQARCRVTVVSPNSERKNQKDMASTIEPLTP